MSTWKKMADKMPKKNELVIIKTTAGTIHCCSFEPIMNWFQEEGGFSPPAFYIDEVEYWCEIPKFDLS